MTRWNTAAGRVASGAMVVLLLCPIRLAAQDTTGAQDRVNRDTAAQALSADTIQPVPSVADYAVPVTYEAVPRANAVVDSAEAALSEVDRLADLTDVQQETDKAEARIRTIDARLADLRRSEYARPDRISSVHDGALNYVGRLEDLGASIATRLETLGETRERWRAKRALWRRWRDSLSLDPEYGLLAADVDEAVDGVDRVLDRVGMLYPSVLGAQREAESLRRRFRDAAAEATTLRVVRRQALLDRSTPVLLTPAYLQQLGPGLVKRAIDGAEDALAQMIVFLPGVAWLLVLHGLVILGLAQMARRLKARVSNRDPAFARPVSIGLFVTTALLGAAYAPAPAAWEVLMWTTLSISGSRIASRLLRDRRTRTLVYLVAAIYPVFLLMEAVSLPAPLFRPALLLLVLVGVVVQFVEVRRRGGPGIATPVGHWSVRVAGAALAFVAVADVLGFDQLAFWVVQASIAAAFVIFVVVLLIRLTRSTIQTMLSTEPKGRLRFVRRIGYQLADRLTWLVQAVLWLGAILYVLDVWEIAPSPLRTWNVLIGAGFHIGDVEITLGRVLLAALVMYLVTLLSWLARASVEARALERWNIDRGMSNSISRILHYALLAFGFLLAARMVGFGLSNFALVAGALGVGIGFGLQNVVNNFVSGLILLFERPIRVGDIVVVGDQWGTIQNIGLRATTILDFDESETIVPNADLVSQRVTNWTLSSSVARLVVPVGVAYGSDVAKVLEVLLAAAGSEEIVLDSPEPQALFRGFGDSSLNFELRVWLADVRSLPKLQS
ncbi:MAG: mechanosensitive ion channel domain-containing protein, partial [Gemmatimonadota bacterium]